jgi:predicted cytidylate kinase
VLHLTISGDLGSGKSSVAEALANHLGFDMVSTGAIQRRIAADLGVSTLQANLIAETDLSIDERIDSTTVRLAQEAATPIVFDSRMAWHFVPNALRVRLVVDPLVAAERILGRGPGNAEAYDSLEQAFDQVLERADAEVRRFTDRYGVDISRLANFDLVVETTALTVEQVVAVIAGAYRRATSSQASDAATDARFWASPRSVVPAFENGPAVTPPAGPDADDAIGEALGEAEAVSVVYARPFTFAVGGRARLADAIGRGEGVIPVTVVAEGDDEAPGGVPATVYPTRYGVAPATLAWAREYGLDYRGLTLFLRREGHFTGSEQEFAALPPDRSLAPDDPAVAAALYRGEA